MLQGITRNGSRSPYTGIKVRRRRKTSKEERVCPVCAQMFKKAEHLARHVRSHTKEKPFICLVCQKAFSRQDTLLRHSRSHSVDDSNFEKSQLSCESLNDHCETVQAPLDSTKSTARSMMAPVSPPNSATIDNATPIFSLPEPTIHQAQTMPLGSLFSLETDNQRGSSQPTSWDYRLDSDWETLLTGDNFDLDAVNTSLLHATSDFPPALDIPDIPGLEHARPKFDEDPEERASVLQQKWHTFSEVASLSGETTPEPSQYSDHIDDTYRHKLHERLQPRVQHGILPSTSFLNLCLQFYFSKFHPLFPVVHVPTFRPGTQNSILLLSICSVGSLIIGSTRALSHGISMFERLNKAILASWESYLSKPGFTSTIALQASLIGQTFGLLMGRPKDLFGIDVFHGSIISWARKAKLFLLEHSNYNLLDIEGESLNDVWMAWIQDEVNMRIVLGLYIHDAELAKLHHHEPLLRHSLSRLPQISSNELFAASTANSWKTLMIRSHYQPPSPAHTNLCSSTPEFASLGMLESVSALASEEFTDVLQCHTLLTTWYTQYALVYKPASWLSLLILWHSIFMSLHVDFNILELTLGRDGDEASQKALPHAQKWIHSPDAKRCLLHAMLLQNHCESLPMGAESAIHLPLSLYHCGIIWAAFMCFSEQNSDAIIVDAADYLQFEELHLSGAGDLMNFGVLVPSRLALGSVFRVVGLLQRIGHWKISKSLASTLLGIVETREYL